MTSPLKLKVLTSCVTSREKKNSNVWDRVCSIFSGAGKFCLAHGLRQLTHAALKVTSYF